MHREILIPEGHTSAGLPCEADKQIEDETVRCGDPCVSFVIVDGLYRYVCAYHLELLKKERDA
jgi:hypothetical protein